jgi:hypothetical protein
MKTLELKNYSVNELSFDEALSIEGGSFWSKLGEVFGYIAGAIVIGLIGSLILLSE